MNLEKFLLTLKYESTWKNSPKKTWHIPYWIEWSVILRVSQLSFLRTFACSYQPKNKTRSRSCPAIECSKEKEKYRSCPAIDYRVSSNLCVILTMHLRFHPLTHPGLCINILEPKTKMLKRNLFFRKILKKLSILYKISIFILIF